MIPQHAIQIWTDGTNFAIALPNGEGKRHTVRIPLDQPERLVRMLQARHRGMLRISEDGAPTQWNIDRERSQIEAHQVAILAELGL